MFKKINNNNYLFFFTSNANAGSDGELILKKKSTSEVKDCFENLNRATFAFNQGLDKAILKPVAKGYRIFTFSNSKGTK